MRTSMTLGLCAIIATALSAAACGSQKERGDTQAAIPERTSTTRAATAPAATVTATAIATSAPVPSEVAPSPSGSADASTKTYDCGAKGQKPCPMQGWMKTTMAAASSSGDGDKLASALSYVAAHVPPGFAGWAAIASAGAAKAKAGDIDGAKLSCKQCHDAYKEKYKATMRDRPY
jgi:hypothetical protein